ncbi:MAG: hypothetical protein HY800_07535 [Ignavibacteriales bacterium]|nr:hypothetical protein [Ignavibacteriales bacterium]
MADNLIHDIGKMNEILLEDLSTLEMMVQNYDNQTWRRAYARAFFAMVEATLYNLKIGMFFAQHPLVEEEIELLFGKRKSISPSTLRPVRMTIVENLTKTFSMYASIHCSNYQLRINTKGWQYFLKSIKIRRRVTHPKSVKEFELSNKEISILIQTKEWYLINLMRLVESSYKSLRAEINGPIKMLKKREKEKISRQLKLLTTPTIWD